METKTQVTQSSVKSAPQNGTHTTANDEQVHRWLLEYVRRRDGGGEDTPYRRGESMPLSTLKGCIAHHYTPMVELIARRFLGSGEPFEDMVQEGFVGLLSALEHYSPNKGVKFNTYATHFVAGAIRHCLRDRGKIIKEPAWLSEVYGKINRTSDTLTQTLGRAPHASEIAPLLNLTEEAVEEILSTRQVFQVVAFDSPSEGDDSMAGLVDPEKIRSDRLQTLRLPIEDRIVLEEAATRLKALEQTVLYEFFYKDLNQTEIARKMGISCNYVSHILKNSTKKLRKMLGEAEARDRLKDKEAATIIDTASGLYTQAHLLARIDEEVSRSVRINKPVALLYAACHQLPSAGAKRDEVWNLLGNAVRKNIRRMDIAGRSDNGLVVLLPQTGDQVTTVADRLLSILLGVGAAHHARLRVDVGVAVFPTHGRTAQDLINRARADAGLPLETELPTPVATTVPTPVPA